MRVLHIIARFNVGGTATWITNLSEELVRMGHEVHLLAGEVESNEKEDERFSVLGGIRIKGLSRRVSMFSDLNSIFEIRKQIRAIKPDVINTHTAKAGVVGRIANLLLFSRKAPIVHTVHGHLLTGYFSKRKVKVIIIIERVMAKFTDLILFAGLKVAEDCLAVGIGDRNHMGIVRPGLKPIIFAPRSSLRFTYAIKEDEMVVGWLARFTQVKRPDLVIALAERFPNVSFLLGGDGELLGEMMLRAPRNCKFLGWVEPQSFWSACDLALLTSENEAVPISLIEAQMFGLPALATDAGSTSEVVIPSFTGWIVDVSIESLSKGLSLVIESKDLNTFGQNAKSYSSEMFSIEKHASDHLRYYELAKGETRIS